ncbi:flagellar biosynthetic protein FliO [Roseibium aquae]|nr:flagellar biosynthetic protein FliO [Roseibium aquae]
MYNWIESTFGFTDEIARALAFGISLVVVLVLFALFIFILKRLTGGSIASPRGRQPRIAIMDAATIDTRRRLVLVRRDNVEHLILIGGTSDIVVEQGIVRGAPLAATAQPAAPQRTFPAAALPPAVPAMDEPVSVPPAPRVPAPETAQAARPGPEPDVSAAPQPQLPDAGRAQPDTRESEPAWNTGKAARAASSLIKSAAGSFGKLNRPSLSSQEPPAKPQAALENSRARSHLRAVPPAGDQFAEGEERQEESGHRADAPPSQTAGAPGQIPSPSDRPAAPSPATSRTVEPQKTPDPARARPGLVDALTRPIARASSALESAARHTITPPASGPAAKARTALFSPLAKAQTTPPEAGDTHQPPKNGAPAAHADTPRPLTRVEPGLMGGTRRSPEPQIPSAAGTTDPAAGGLESPDAAPIPPKTGQEPAMRSIESSLPDGSPATAETEAAKPNASGGPATRHPSDDTAEPAPALSTVMQDDPSQAQETAPDVAPAVARPVPDRTVTPIHGNKETAAAPAIKMENDRPSAHPANSPIERNPIEEEMAKLLDEIGGNRKT